MSSLLNKEELSEWLEKIEDVSKQVNDILNDKVDLENLPKPDEKAEKKRLAREAKAKKEEQEKKEKILKGRDGAGDKDNYENYCRKCRVEFIIEMPKCTRCGKETVMKQERKNELLEMVDKYKDAKSRKQERKKKWELWKKTQAMFWKKTSTNYEKWEYFTDSEDEFEKLEKEAPPVLPDNDPGFRAMKSDLDQRAYNRKQRAKEAQELKAKANDLMKKKMYDRAAQVYSEAIELFRNNKYLWSNRALAYIKQNEFEKAIDDCTKMLEYAEVLENGYIESLDVNFKFFARRAIAYKGLKKYDLALKDIESALSLIPNDKSAEETKKELVELISISKKLDELTQKLETQDLSKNFTESQIAVKALIDEFVRVTSDSEFKKEENRALIRDYDYFKFKDIIKDENLKLYFLHVQGLKALKRVFKADLYTVTTSEKLNLIPFIQVLCESNAMLQEQTVEVMLVRVAIKKIMIALEELFPNNIEKAERNEIREEETKAQTKTEDQEEMENIEEKGAEEERKEQEAQMRKRMDQIFDYKIIELEAIFEMLITLTENRNVRAYLRDKAHLLIPVFKILHENVFPKADKEFSLLSSVISFYSNLCMSDIGIKNTEIRENFTGNYLGWIFSFGASVLARPQSKYFNLKNSCLAFTVNLSTDKKFRDHTINMILTFEGLHKDNQRITVSSDDFNHVAYFMQSLGICFNLVYKKVAEGHLKEQAEMITKFYEHSTGILLNLFFQLTDKSIVLHMQRHFKRWKLDTVCIDILHSILKNKINAGVLMNRFVNIVAKLGFEDTPINNEKMFFVVCEIARIFPEKTDENQLFFTDAIRFLASIFQEKKEIGKQAIQKCLGTLETYNKHLKSIIKNETNNTMRYELLTPDSVTPVV